MFLFVLVNSISLRCICGGASGVGLCVDCTCGGIPFERFLCLSLENILNAQGILPSQRVQLVLARVYNTQLELGYRSRYAQHVPLWITDHKSGQADDISNLRRFLLKVGRQEPMINQKVHWCAQKEKESVDFDVWDFMSQTSGKCCS